MLMIDFGIHSSSAPHPNSRLCIKPMQYTAIAVPIVKRPQNTSRTHTPSQRRQFYLPSELEALSRPAVSSWRWLKNSKTTGSPKCCVVILSLPRTTRCLLVLSVLHLFARSDYVFKVRITMKVNDAMWHGCAPAFFADRCCALECPHLL